MKSKNPSYKKDELIPLNYIGILDIRYVSYCPVEAPEHVNDIAVSIARMIQANATLAQVEMASTIRMTDSGDEYE